MKPPLLVIAGWCVSMAAAVAAQPGLTIYNQNFAVVRDQIALDLKQGENSVIFDGATMQVEPDSVILRDPAGNPLQILEQSYRNDPLSQGLLLSLFEGKEIDFSMPQPMKPDRIVRGKVIRSGYQSPAQAARNAVAVASEPIIEIEGKIQFGLPGQPIFPSLGDDTILKPRLSWIINAPKPLKTEAELGYITRGMTWEASYNVVAPEKGNDLDIVGWVTMDNQTGRDFVDARIKLMAGDVNKLEPQEAMANFRAFTGGWAKDEQRASQVTEKTFDEYHLYTLERAVTLHDRETKQVEFIRASGVKSEVIYVYDGAVIDWNRWRGYDRSSLRQNEEFGSDSNSKVSVMREFKNTKENGLGIPLPKGNVRFYRADGKQLEFTGENQIDHTPKDETVRIYTGDAFDLVGERKRTNFKVDNSNDWADESFEITLRNRKTEPVTIRVVEHLLRWKNWEITDKNTTYKKLSSDEIEFLVELKPDEERKITYTVHYSW
ncbi:hypothetical protein TSACC_2476 [Terrimicrobium sacchariphilum]|uniref:DUF4139 domain-containing protein n=1 Tax=Terrimicrobium sacchariphilum TaxID=690879 RepID=A0A146G2J5_TERSA|nr:DUF4139 domain-containing protein [Terrimicrobium sacchariphilum]GAT32079.1 hypothetical protein TSACC_2476 [Terrimicrobium sacchariphilum]